MQKLLLFMVCCQLTFAAASQTKRLGVLGSSTAAGVGASSPDSSFVGLLTYYYQNTEPILAETINLAKSGKDPYFAMPSSYINPPNRPAPNPDSNITKILSFNPDVILVSFASNNYNIYSFEEIKFTLQTIKDSANAAGKVCFISSPQPRTSFNAAGRQKLHDLKDSVMKWFGTFAINFFDSVVNTADLSILAQYRYSGDQIHLNNAGHRVLFRQVLAKDIFSAALPVKLISFVVIEKNETDVLQWKATNEENNTIYLIQKSTNGIHFTNVHSLKANEGKMESDYSFAVEKTGEEIVYYRLEIREDDRMFHSRIVMVKSKGLLSINRIYPNPASGHVFLEIQSRSAQSVSVELLNSSGAILQRSKKLLMPSKNSFQFHIDILPPGRYFIRLIAEDNTRVVKSFIRK